MVVRVNNNKQTVELPFNIQDTCSRTHLPKTLIKHFEKHHDLLERTVKKIELTKNEEQIHQPRP